MNSKAFSSRLNEELNQTKVTVSELVKSERYSSETSSSSVDLTSSNPFHDPKLTAHYRQVYDDAEYECRHVFDPALEWTEVEERKIVRKIDFHVATLACIMFFAFSLDRKNLGQALSDNLLDDLHISTNDYNTGNTLYLVFFMVAELPSRLISKRVGLDRWLPAQIILWSIVAATQAGLNGRDSFFACRALLGILGGGFIADLVLWLSYFYKSGELCSRLCYLWTALDLTIIINNLAACGFSRLRGVAGLAGWRWMFLIEGLITLLIGIASFFLMPASAVETKSWLRPKGWFDDREIGIVVNRVLRDDPTKGDMRNRTGINLAGLWQAITDYDLWPIYLIAVVGCQPQSPPGMYLTLSLRQLGFSTIHTNLLSIPNEVVSIFTLQIITKISERIDERSLVSAFTNVWLLPCLLALRFWPGAHSNAWGTYGLITALLSYPNCHAILVAWISRNAASVQTRSVAVAVYNMANLLGHISAANIYRTHDAPLYKTGNSVLVALDILAILLFIGAKVYYIMRNRNHTKKWSALTDELKANYIQNSTDTGNKRLEFRFKH